MQATKAYTCAFCGAGYDSAESACPCTANPHGVLPFPSTILVESACQCGELLGMLKVSEIASFYGSTCDQCILELKGDFSE